MNAESLKPSESAMAFIEKYSSPLSSETTRMVWLSAMSGFLGGGLDGVGAAQVGPVLAGRAQPLNWYASDAFNGWAVVGGHGTNANPALDRVNAGSMDGLGKRRDATGCPDGFLESVDDFLHGPDYR